MDTVVWHFSARVTKTDGSEIGGIVLQDEAASKVSGSRIVNDQEAIDNYAKYADVVKQFVAAMGYTASSGSLPSDVNDVVFRFMAIATDGGSVYVAGSSDDISPTVESDDLDTILGLLNADSSFVTFMNSLA
jgi:hypothetical protein